MTGLSAAILYSRAHREDYNWGDDTDHGIMELLVDGVIEYDPLTDMIYYAKDS